MLKKIALISMMPLLLSGCSLFNNDDKIQEVSVDTSIYSNWIKSTNVDEVFIFNGTSEYKRESFYYIKPTIDSLSAILGENRINLDDSVLKQSNPNEYFCVNRNDDSILIVGSNKTGDFNGYISIEELIQFSDAIKKEVVESKSQYLNVFFPGISEDDLPYKMINYQIKIDKEIYSIILEADSAWNLLINKNYSEFDDPGNLNFSELPTNDYMPFKIYVLLKQDCAALPIEE